MEVNFLASGLGLTPPIWSDRRGEGVFPNLEVGSLDCGRGGSDSAYPKIEWEKNRGRAHVRSVTFLASSGRNCFCDAGVDSRHYG